MTVTEESDVPHHVRAVGTRLHHGSRLHRSGSNHELSTIPDTDQLHHMLDTLKQSLRRGSEIRRKIEREQRLFSSLDENERSDPNVYSRHSEVIKKLEIDLKRMEAFVRRYTDALAHISDGQQDCLQIKFMSAPVSPYASAPASPTLQNISVFPNANYDSTSTS
ncbi:hypothetical protein V1511DRAFT_485746 [Dipodascopsis uninucleata]